MQTGDYDVADSKCVGTRLYEKLHYLWQTLFMYKICVGTELYH